MMMSKHLDVCCDSSDIKRAVLNLENAWIPRPTCGECEHASRDENGEDVRDVSPEAQTTEFECRSVEPQTLASLYKENCYKIREDHACDHEARCVYSWKQLHEHCGNDNDREQRRAISVSIDNCIRGLREISSNAASSSV